MMTAKQSIDWRSHLPPLRGRLTENAPLSAITWFRVGGVAELMFRPADIEDLQCFLAARPLEVPVTVIGVGSNLLVRDGGVPGVVIRLGRAFAEIAVEGSVVMAGTAALDVNVARFAQQEGLAGLEFLSGIPGTIGGAIRMNAGAYSRDMSDVVELVEAIDLQGRHHYLTPSEIGFSYRHIAASEELIFTSVRLRGTPDDDQVILQRMKDIQSRREQSQPIRSRTGGSTFANPLGPEAAGRKAWELIDAAGCRGLRRGGAMVSQHHCNFLINTGTATAADLEELGEEVRRRVFASSGIRLEWEIRRIGRALQATEKPWIAK